MPGEQPFEPNVKSGSAGLTVAISVQSSSNPSVLNSTGGFAPCVLVTNVGPVTAWVRMSNEAVPVATTTDTPILANTVRLFSNPNPTGSTGLAVIATVSGSGVVYFSPGQGGI